MAAIEGLNGEKIHLEYKMFFKKKNESINFACNFKAKELYY